MATSPVKLPPGFVLEEPPPQGIKLPPGFVLEQKPAEQPGMLKAGASELWRNISPVQAIKGLAQATGSPLETGKAILGSQGALYGKAKDAFAKGDYLEGSRHALNYLVPVLGPLSNEYGTMLKSGDPEQKARALGGTLGMVMNLLTPAAIKRLPNMKPGMPRGQNIAKKLYQSALKPGPGTYSSSEVTGMVKTGLEERLPISDAGMKKLGGLVSDLQNKVKQTIAGKPNAEINPRAVATRIGPAITKFKKQVNPEADVVAIKGSGEEFLRQHQTPATPAKTIKSPIVDQYGKPLTKEIAEVKAKDIPIAAASAQELKTGTYKQLGDRAYGELKTATVEAQKSLARGLKEELDTIFPEIKGLNAKEGGLLDLKPALEHAVRRVSNHDLLGLGALGTAGAAGVAFGEQGLTAAATAGILYRVLGDPAVKSRIAYSLYWASKKSGSPLTHAAAVAKINRTLNLLEQAQRQAEPSAMESRQ